MKKIINYSEEADSLNNIVYIPDNVNTDICELPLLVYLHGAGERGSNLSHLSKHAIPRLIDNGGEYPAVVLPLLTGPKMLMTRNLLYTAVTRAKKCVTIVGTYDAVEEMISNNNEIKRNSSLKYMIKNVVNSLDE